MINNFDYNEMVRRIREVTLLATHPGAIIAVVSKGDSNLLQIEGREAWHFPRREDGVYAGYYPEDSSGAIEHLEALRAKGADFILFPQQSLWWLEHYGEFRRHLRNHYREIVRHEDACLIYALGGTHKSGQEDAAQQALALMAVNNPAHDIALTIKNQLPGEILDDALVLCDIDYYGSQTGISFSSPDEVLTHYLETGAHAGLNPHPLFDTKYYVAHHPDVRALGANPLLHYLLHSVEYGQDPHPWFDTDNYYLQCSGLRGSKINALIHYLRYSPEGTACRPNPLFLDNFYRDTYRDVRNANINPLIHYVTTGVHEGRFVSAVHRNLVETLLMSSNASLFRGNWQNGRVLLIGPTDSRKTMPATMKIAGQLARDYHLECLVVLFERQPWISELKTTSKVVVLDDFRMACDVFRPSAIRLLVANLCSLKPLCAFVETTTPLQALRAQGVPAYYLFSESATPPSRHVLQSACELANRIIFNNSSAFHSAAVILGSYPSNVALRPHDADSGRSARKRTGGSESAKKKKAVASVATFVDSLMALARRDFNLPEIIFNPEHRRQAKATRSIIIPCCDWSLSGVNTSLEALGLELIRLGWDVRIVFTRSKEEILRTAGDGDHLPGIPYSYLELVDSGVGGIWSALIAELENSAPCIMLMSYDFAANGVAPALTNKVGVVGWVQSDDGDYYEQTYRLGRYCNAIVCVSERIRRGVCELNPLIGERAHIIYNSSIRKSEVVKNRPRRDKTLRLIYTGRLVHYQKRVLDFVQLAHWLDHLRVRYQLTLVGEFSNGDNIKEIFEQKAAAHLADGRIRLTGRMNRAGILNELSRHDIFLLLSDFEGLPLSMVEAMAAGCVPIVSEMESGIPEVISNGSNGFIMKGRDYKKWASIIVGLWKDRERLATMSRQARKTVTTRLTVEHVGSQFDQLFCQIAKEICADTYRRPPSLHWGHKRSNTGDVLLPPSMFRPPMYSHGPRLHN